MDEEILQAELKTLTRKHIAERQRRARINSYLVEIQELTCGTNKGQKVKLEKAEVLETALGYLLNNQSETNNNTVIDTDAHEDQAYEDGYRSCMNGILESFEEIGGFKDIVPGLKHHLESVLDETTTHWKADKPEGPTVEESQMAFSPSLAKLEQCLQKFESGSVRGSDTLKGGDVMRGSDAISDISQSDAGSGSETVPYQMAPSNKEISELQSNIEMVQGYSVNDWVNMQREYVIHQQMVFHQQQQQHCQQQMYHQQQTQQHHQTYPFHVQSQNVGAEDLSITNTNNTKQMATNKNQKGHMSTNKDVHEKGDTTKRVEQKQNIKLQVWRPW